MKRIYFVIALLGLIGVGQARAFQVQKTDRYELGPAENIDEQTVIVADQANIMGNAGDDLFIAANEIHLSGHASNDVWLAGNTVELSGTVADHARLAGNTIRVGASVGNSLSAAGAAVQISTSAVIQGSANIAANSATIEGRVGGKVRIMAEQATITGHCDGNVRVIANDIVVTPGAYIGGDLVYTSAKELILDPKVELHGKLIRREMESSPAPVVSRSQLLLVQLYFLVGAFLCGLFLTGLFPRFATSATEVIRHSPLRCTFAGAIALFLVPMMVTMAAITLVGIPFAMLVTAFFAVMIYTAKLIVALALGRVFVGSAGGVWRRCLALLLGLVVLYAAPLVPAAGAIVWFVVVFLGMGAIIVTLIESQRGGSKPPEIPAE